MVWQLLIYVVGEMNVVPHKFKGIPRHCILFVRQTISEWWLHPRFPSIMIVCTSNDDNCYPCKNIGWSDIVGLFSTMISIQGGFWKNRHKKRLGGLISVMVLPFLRYDPFIVCIVLCHFGYVISQFQWKDARHFVIQATSIILTDALPLGFHVVPK